MALPFFAMDIFTRAFGLKISYFPVYYPAPNIFTLLWIVFFIGILMRRLIVPTNFFEAPN